MRAVTLCPACETQFFVTQVQLDQHQGKVRCGECLHVFLATAHLVTQSTPSTGLNTQNHALPDLAPDTNSTIVNNVAPLSDNALSVSTAGLSHSPSSDEEKTATDALTATIVPLGDYVPNTPRSFGRNGRFKPLSKKVVWLSVIGCLLFLTAAFLQTLYFYRAEISVKFPATAPHLKQICQMLDCAIALPANIALIVIDDSDIQEDLELIEVYRFTSTLQNLADYPQTYPNIELTLTNANDQPVLRRLFKPTDYVPQINTIQAGLAAKARMNIRLTISVKDTVLSGYRVSVHY